MSEASRAAIAGIAGFPLWYVTLEQTVVPVPDSFGLGLVAFPVCLIAYALTENDRRFWLSRAMVIYLVYTAAQFWG
ncbi:hypothetical protein [Haloarchaeobius sp. DYHT-AS-18]|uniref:hypothetical protein n=1 Tax=Haloarchaeobius sp. DYHT-AS-18 TaxID=3446117 RepID=UPI003EBF0FD3